MKPIKVTPLYADNTMEYAQVITSHPLALDMLVELSSTNLESIGFGLLARLDGCCVDGFVNFGTVTVNNEILNIGHEEYFHPSTLSESEQKFLECYKGIIAEQAEVTPNSNAKTMRNLLGLLTGAHPNFPDTTLISYYWDPAKHDSPATPLTSEALLFDFDQLVELSFPEATIDIG